MVYEIASVYGLIVKERLVTIKPLEQSKINLKWQNFFLELCNFLELSTYECTLILVIGILYSLSFPETYL